VGGLAAAAAFGLASSDEFGREVSPFLVQLT